MSVGLCVRAKYLHKVAATLCLCPLFPDSGIGQTVVAVTTVFKLPKKNNKNRKKPTLYTHTVPVKWRHGFARDPNLYPGRCV
uniref:Putative secreted protein n=1 Tax=Anopheles darlingi TaxID=43151 RepID=A0A2M4D792_ANODA